ncbi:hypothetical protein BDD12DRAFT_803963 [Trichophaea hybrida]|nr:hypothetical protein BDD12DRAFT_803963 [Trichophaea hybrida]
MLTKFDNLDLGPSPQKPSTRNVSRSSIGSRYTKDTLAMSSISLYASQEKSEYATQHMLNLFLGSLSMGLRFNVEEQLCALEWHPVERRLTLPLGSARIVSCNDGTLIARHQGHDGSWKQINPALPLCALKEVSGDEGNVSEEFSAGSTVGDIPRLNIVETPPFNLESSTERVDAARIVIHLLIKLERDWCCKGEAELWPGTR